MANTAINKSNIRELPRPCFIDWLVREDQVSIEGCSVECFRLEGSIDDAALAEWARHIRRHYIRDDELHEYSEFYQIGKTRYLRENVPQIRAGDFAEIVISDLVQFVVGYEVPRYKQHGRSDKNSSEHGTDIVAFKMKNPPSPSKYDELLAIEVKSRSSSTDLKGAISDAAKDSPKDRSRIAMTLSYYSKRSLDAGDVLTSSELKRFMNASEHPFKEAFAIAAIAGIGDAERHLEGLSASDLCVTKGETVFVIHKSHLMDLIHEIYDRCTS
mgnify:CR=1 FL=1